jgi:ABC-type sugar transport system ATPase subunit
MLAVELRGVSKSFDGTQALREVSFSVQPGEVTALVGENGAGKSTLLRIMSGVIRADSGQVLIFDRPVHFSSPKDAQRAGIAIIHQELSTVPDLTVAENVFLDRLPQRGVFVDWRRLHAECRLLLQRLGVDMDPRTRVGDLALARQQMVEIAHAIAQDARVIAMDEPTASLSQDEVTHLFRLIRQLRANHVTVIFVSHRLEEVFEIADRIVVLRDGQVVAGMQRSETTPDRVIELMVGRALERQFPNRSGTPGKTVLEVRDLHTKKQLHSVSLVVRQGEIVGLAGLVGAGRSELAQAIFGAEPISRGEILIEGQPVRLRNPGDAIRHGIGLVTEDRKKSGLILSFPLYMNHTLPSLRRFVRGWRLVPRLEIGAFKQWADKLQIHSRSSRQEVRFLSGGNQQKVVLAKWLELKPRLLILDEPTRGVDVATKAEIYRLINDLAAQGTAILMISSDLPEVLGMSDRVVVMHDGRVTGEFNRAEATNERVMQAAIA